ncbi:MAG: AAA family ATPase [Methanomicrobiaceae archaeon]|nr:AAA family ATPase [Methanomicrobiaceae archaeon]
MRITISGPPGSGTSSLAGYLARVHGYGLISAGEVFRMLAREKGMDIAAFGKLAETDPSVDRSIDTRQKEIGEAHDNIVIEGRLAGWMVGNADLKIWVCAPLDIRAGRIADREDIPVDTASVLTLERESCEAARYHTYYDIEIDDLSPYDMVLSSAKWGREALGRIVDTAIDCLSR